MSKSWSGGSTWAWRKTRATVLNRDGHRCRLAHPGCTVTAIEVHHLDGKSVGDDPSRCIAVCRHCHKIETSKQIRVAANKQPKAHRVPGKHPGLL